MKIYTPEECEQWVKYKKRYDYPMNILTFDCEEIDGEKLYLTEPLADVSKKCFTHNQERMELAIHKLKSNYPQFNKLVDNLKIFMSPKPALSFSNACCWGDTSSIAMWARTTQIPHVMTDYIIIHEIGHMIQKQFAPERGRENGLFREYLTLRNAPKSMYSVYKYYDEEKQESIYEDELDFDAIHKGYSSFGWDLSPIEWFAEDFRYLFGVDVEPYWGLPINLPDEKIKDFILSLEELKS